MDSMFGLAGELLEQALEIGRLAPAALAPLPASSPRPASGSIAPAAVSTSQQLPSAVRKAATISKYDGLRLLLRQATVEQVGGSIWLG